MKSVLWFILGITGGFVAAHVINKDPRGREVLADVDARIAGFTERIQEAYREQEAKFAQQLHAVGQSADAAVSAVKTAIGDATDPAVAAPVEDADPAVAEAPAEEPPVEDTPAESASEAPEEAPKSAE